MLFYWKTQIQPRLHGSTKESASLIGSHVYYSHFINTQNACFKYLTVDLCIILKSLFFCQWTFKHVLFCDTAYRRITALGNFKEKWTIKKSDIVNGNHGTYWNSIENNNNNMTKQSFKAYIFSFKVLIHPWILLLITENNVSYFKEYLSRYFVQQHVNTLNFKGYLQTYFSSLLNTF